MDRMSRVGKESSLARAQDCLGYDVTAHLTPSLQGVITVKGLVDREKGDFYTLTVVADDGGPKVDSTVVSGSPAESPTGTACHRSKSPHTDIFTTHPTCRQAVGEGLGSPGMALQPAVPHLPGQPGQG